MCDEDKWNWPRVGNLKISWTELPLQSGKYWWFIWPPAIRPWFPICRSQLSGRRCLS